MRSTHRILCLFSVLFMLYLGVTGTLIQMVDLRTLLSHAPANDPNMMAIREGFSGPDNFEVITTRDYAAAALPSGFDYQGALSRLLSSAPAQLGDAPLGYVEWRIADGKPVGLIQSGQKLLRYDFSTDQAELGPTPKREPSIVPSIRNTFKHWHRMTEIGHWAMWLNPLISIALCVFLVSGLVLYVRLLAARRRANRGSWFWQAGGWWRSLHRWVSVCAAAFLIVVALSGSWLAVESLGLDLYFAAHRPGPAAPQAAPAGPSARPNGISPLRSADLPTMLATVLAAWRADAPGQPIKALRLRIYGGMPQGVLIAGEGDQTQQLIYNAVSGRRASLTEPGYPETGFPFGWQAHQIAKKIHRGDYLGLSGRWMDLFAGLSLVFLSLSGAVMYFNMWKRRQQSGRRAPLWIR